MKIDTKRIAAIVREYAQLDPMEAYYRNKTHSFIASPSVVPETQAVLAKGMDGAETVLDVGCGDGHSLIANADLFLHGFGIDESDYVIGRAAAAAASAHVSNVSFQVCKAIALPFSDSTFDFVFTERGPLGHADCTLVEAIRVLRPGGLIFIETGGSHNMIELSREDGLTHEGTLLTSLEIERDRFQRHGLDIQLLASRKQTLAFADIYQWFAYRCSVLRYIEEPQPWPSDSAYLLDVAKRAGHGSDGLTFTYHTIWIGGSKPQRRRCP